MEGSSNNNNNNPPTSAAPSSPSSSSNRPAPVARTGSPPWTQIVRGPESDSAGTPSSPSAAAGEPDIPPTMDNPAESSDNGNAGNNKKPAWNKKPSNGPVVDSGPVVMGASSWPALSKSTKASPKLSSSDSSKSLSDSGYASASSTQVTGIITTSPSSTVSSPLPSPSPSQSSVSSPRLMASNANNNPNFNQGRPARQKSMKRDGGGSSSQANGGFSHSGEGGSHNHNSNSSVRSGSSGFEGSNRDNSQGHGNTNRDGGSRNAGGGGGGDHHPQHRNSFRRGGNGGRGGGDVSYSGGRGGNGDHDRLGNHDWRNFNGRDAPLQPSGGAGPRGFVRPPPVSGTFVHPAAAAAPMRPFMNPMDVPVLYFPTTAMPFVASVPPPMYFPPPDPQLQAKITSQIDYYFSNENLIKDTFLRQNMDAEGWVPVTLIAGFKKVKLLTDNIQLILEAVQFSSVVEAQGDKIRKCDDWMRWIMPPAVKFPVTSSQSPKSPNVAAVSAHIQSVTLDEKATGAEASFRSSLGDSNSPSTKDGASSSGC